MKVFLFTILFFSATLFANVNALTSSSTYKGEEYVNQRRTGQICYVSVSRLKAREGRIHCQDIEWRYASSRDDIPKVFFKGETAITNEHRVEYPEKITCAMNVNGTSFGDEIYSLSQTSILYTPFFHGLYQEGSTEFHHYLNLSPQSKDLVSARIHVLKMFREYDVDCLHLEKM